VEEQNGLNKAAAPNIPGNSQRPYFLLYFHSILRLIVQMTNNYIQQDAQEIKPDISDSQQISMKDLYAFLKLLLKCVTTKGLL
jgi:hypothetical protein